MTADYLSERVARQEKLVSRFLGKPKDFTWQELKQLLAGFGYDEHAGSSSRCKFVHPIRGVVISSHRPHPDNKLKPYQVRDVLEHLRQEGLL